MNMTYILDIDAPIERAFACVDDNEMMKKWMDGLVSTEYPHGENAGNPVGTKFKQKIKEGRKVVEYDGEVIGYQQPSLLAVRLGNQMFSVEAHYRFEETSGGTRLTYECRFLHANTVVKIMGKLFGWFTKRILVKQMTKLKALAEQPA